MEDTVHDKKTRRRYQKGIGKRRENHGNIKKRKEAKRTEQKVKQKQNKRSTH